jgi:hypothetical protein
VIRDSRSVMLADWLGELRRDLLFGPGDPAFPRQRMGLGSNGAFEAQGFERHPYASATRVVTVCKDAFSRAGLPPYTPHLLRKTLVSLASTHCATPEQFKAWNQNLGQLAHPARVLRHQPVPARQGEIRRTGARTH